ncbi:MAG: response regulator [Candidatus Thorarchaeota archaeon]
MDKNDDKQKNDCGKNRYNILIVDDDKIVLKALHMTLQRATQFKSEISVSNDVDEALQKIHDENFDLVISDFSMPKMNGIEFLLKVKELHPETTRVLITGYAELESAKETQNDADIEMFLEKPWNNEKLRETVLKILEKKKNFSKGEYD